MRTDRRCLCGLSWLRLEIRKTVRRLRTEHYSGWCARLSGLNLDVSCGVEFEEVSGMSGDHMDHKGDFIKNCIKSDGEQQKKTNEALDVFRRRQSFCPSMSEFGYMEAGATARLEISLATTMSDISEIRRRSKFAMEGCGRP
jgi:hypothetical protein